MKLYKSKESVTLTTNGCVTAGNAHSVTPLMQYTYIDTVHNTLIEGVVCNKTIDALIKSVTQTSNVSVAPDNAHSVAQFIQYSYIDRVTNILTENIVFYATIDALINRVTLMSNGCVTVGSYFQISKHSLLRIRILLNLKNSELC